jgi:signal transduction histidine kinase
MEVKSKAISFENKQREKLINFETESIATDLVKDMYISLKKQKIKLTPEQSTWMNKVESAYAKNKLAESDFICSILENAYNYLNRTGKWNDPDNRAYEMFEKLIFLKAKDGAFQDFLENAEKAIRSTLSLDFSKKASLCDEKLDERNILNYITFALNMVIEKIESSMVSMKVINAMLAAPTLSAFIVTDTKGSIRFISNVGESLFGIQHNEFLNQSIYPLFKTSDVSIKNVIENEAELKDVKVQLVLNENTIPVLLTAVHSNTEEDEINEVVFIIKTKEQAEKEMKVKHYARQHNEDKIAPLNSISEMLHLLKSKSKDIDSQHLITFLEESVDIIKKDKQDGYTDDNAENTLKKDLINIEFIYDRIIEGLRFNDGFSEVTFYKDISHEHDLYSDAVLFYSILQKLITTAINHRHVKSDNKIQFTVRDFSSTHLLIIVQFTCGEVSVKDLNNLFEKNIRDIFNIDAKNSEHISVKEAIHKLNGSLDIYNKSGKDVVFTVSLPY